MDYFVILTIYSLLHCIAGQSISGSVELVIVIIIYRPCSVIPRILEHPRDVAIEPHGTAYFTCRYSTSPHITQVTWFLEGRQINSADILGDGTLVIKNVDSSASGRYSCRIQTEVVIASDMLCIITMGEVAGRSCTVKTSKADSSCQEREATDHPPTTVHNSCQGRSHCPELLGHRLPSSYLLLV